MVDFRKKGIEQKCVELNFLSDSFIIFCVSSTNIAWERFDGGLVGHLEFDLTAVKGQIWLPSTSKNKHYGIY